MWVIIVIAFALGVMSTTLFDMEDDNIFEEVSEEVIESQSGLDIDITPKSPEL